MDGLDITDESDFIKEIENINFDEIDDNPPVQLPIEADDKKSSPAKNNTINNYATHNKKSGNANISSDKYGNNSVKKNYGEKIKRLPAKRRPPVKIHFPSTLDLDALLNDTNNNDDNNNNNNNNNNKCFSDDFSNINDKKDINNYFDYNNDDDNIDIYEGRAQSARPDYNGLLSSRTDNNACLSARPNYGCSYPQQRGGKFGNATNTSVSLLEARMINYLNNSMNTLKEEFVFDLKNLFESVDHIDSIFDAFIMSMNSELRREISFKADPIDHNLVNSVNFPIDLNANLYFLLKNNKISNFPVHEYIEQVSDLASSISKTLKSGSLSISEEFQIRDSEISKSYFEDKALKQKVEHLKRKESRLQYQLQEKNCEKYSIEKYRKIIGRKIEDFESQISRYEERAAEIKDIKKHFDKFKDDLSRSKIVNQKRGIIKKLKQALTENEELNQYCGSLEMAVSSFKNWTDDIKFAFLAIGPAPPQMSATPTLPISLANDLAICSSESSLSPQNSSATGCASDSPRFYSDDVKYMQQQQQTKAIAIPKIKKRIERQILVDDDDDDDDDKDFEKDNFVGDSRTGLANFTIERRFPLRINNFV